MTQFDDSKDNRMSEVALLQAFAVLDGNNDGVISAVEIDKAVSDSSLDPRWAPASAVFQLSSLM